MKAKFVNEETSMLKGKSPEESQECPPQQEG